MRTDRRAFSSEATISCISLATMQLRGFNVRGILRIVSSWEFHGPTMILVGTGRWQGHDNVVSPELRESMFGRTVALNGRRALSNLLKLPRFTGSADKNVTLDKNHGV